MDDTKIDWDKLSPGIRPKISRVMGVLFSKNDKWELYFNKLDTAGKLNIKNLTKILAVVLEDYESRNT